MRHLSARFSLFKLRFTGLQTSTQLSCSLTLLRLIDWKLFTRWLRDGQVRQLLSTSARYPMSYNRFNLTQRDTRAFSSAGLSLTNSGLLCSWRLSELKSNFTTVSLLWTPWRFLLMSTKARLDLPTSTLSRKKPLKRHSTWLLCHRTFCLPMAKSMKWKACP